MTDLIDRQAAIDALFGRSHEIIKARIGNLPSVQSEIIRCRDCKWYLPNYTKSPFDTDGFDRWGGLANCQNENGLTECSDESYCSCGERRES